MKSSSRDAVGCATIRRNGDLPNGTESSEKDEYTSKLKSLNENKRKKEYIFDDFCLIHSDNLWYMWCIINEFTDTNNCILLNKMNYPMFCAMCYENSSRT